MKRILFSTLIILVHIMGFTQETTRTYPDPGVQKKLQVDSLTKCITDNPSHALAYALRGEIVFHLNHNNPRQKHISFSNADALLDIKRAINIEPKNPQFYKILSDYYFYVDHNLDSAIITITKPILIDPSNPTWYHRRGFLKAKAGKWDDACEDWKFGSTLQGEQAQACKKSWDNFCKK